MGEVVGGNDRGPRKKTAGGDNNGADEWTQGEGRVTERDQRRRRKAFLSVIPRRETVCMCMWFA